MHIGVSGTGPALVMVHGWAMHGGIFAPLRERLESHYTVHTVDLPGHGLSRHCTQPLQLDAVARHIGAHTPPALWLGWSLGGLVALHAAQRYPASVRSLVMLCASPRFVKTDGWPEGMATNIFTTFADDLGRDYRGTLDRFLMLEAQGSDQVRAELRLLRDAVFAHGEPDPRVLGEGLALLQDSDLRAGLGSLAMPSLWLAGRRDRLVSPQAMQRAAELAPRARFAQVDSAGHAPFLTHADAVLHAIDAFAGEMPA
jgi:pimeloyl-[acyl-carrier protein] methyl ester esterase